MGIVFRDQHQRGTQNRKGFGRRGFSRRWFIRAGSVALALPMLEFTHRRVWAAQEDQLQGIIFVGNHGGCTVDYQTDGCDEYADEGINRFRPLNALADPAGPLVLNQVHAESMAHLKEYLTIFELDNKQGVRKGNYGGGHRFCNVTTLQPDLVRTVPRPDGDGVYYYATKPSVDNILAEFMYNQNPGAYRQAKIDATVGSGIGYGSMVSEGYGENSTTVLGYRKPQEMFDALFADIEPGGGPSADDLARRARRHTVVDRTLAELNAFRSRLGTQDKQVLDSHVSAMHELERRIGDLPPIGDQCFLPDVSGADNDDTRNVTTNGPIIFELAAAAAICGLAPVITVQIADTAPPEWMPPDLTEDALREPTGHNLHHWLRYADTPSKRQEWAAAMAASRIGRHRWIAQLCDRLKAVPFGSGNLLDHWLGLVIPEFSRGERHTAKRLGITAFGRAAGRLSGNRYLKFGDFNAEQEWEMPWSTHNLFNTVCRWAGMQLEHYGDPEVCDRIGENLPMR